MRTIRRRWNDERGSVLLLSLFIMAFLLVAGGLLLRLSSAETDIAYNTVWSEGSFYAAEAAISVGVDQLGPNLTANWTPTPATTALDAYYSYTPQVTFEGTTAQPGYSIGSGTGYNPGGYVFYTYTANGTGNGPRSAARQIQARAIYGPMAQ